MGRPPGDARAKLLEATTWLIVNQGFAGTTVDEICARAHVTKGAFFHHFASKDDAALAALDAYREHRSAIQESYLQDHKSPRARVLARIDFLTTPEATRFHGCLVGVLAVETGRTHPAIRAKCDETFRLWTEELTRDLAAAAPHASAAEVSAFAQTVLAAFEGALILAKCTNDFAKLKATLEHLKALLESCMQPSARRGRKS